MKFTELKSDRPDIRIFKYYDGTIVKLSTDLISDMSKYHNVTLEKLLNDYIKELKRI